MATGGNHADASSAKRSFRAFVMETRRVVLRPCDDGDASALFAMYSDEQTMRYWSSTPWTDPAEGLCKVARDREALDSGTAFGLGIEERASGLLIGTCALHAFHHVNRRCEIGYLLSRSHWGRGLMSEALKPLLRHAFDVIGLHRIEADIDPDNVASARLLEALGFRAEGRLRERWLVGGRFSDSQLYGLLASDASPS